MNWISLQQGGGGGRGDRKRPRKKRRQQESEHPFPSILGKNATISSRHHFCFHFFYKQCQCTIFLIFSVHATIKAAHWLLLLFSGRLAGESNTYCKPNWSLKSQHLASILPLPDHTWWSTEPVFSTQMLTTKDFHDGKRIEST